MTVSQKKTRNVLEKANKTDSRETLHCVRNLLQDFVGDFSTNGGAPRTLFTDEHKDYPKAIRIVDPDHRFFSHQTISSKKYRNYRNYLFVANYTDRQLRKDSANFVRETVQFARCPQAMLTRTTIYEVYHNCFSPWRIKQWRKKDQRSRAELMGIPTERLGLLVKQTWGKRGFRGKCHLWVEEAKTWEMKWRNPGIPMGRRVAKYILV